MKFEKFSIGDKWILSSKPGCGRQTYLNGILGENSENFDLIIEWDFLFSAPLGIFLNQCNKSLVKLNDLNMQSSMERPNTNYMMILNPLFSSLRAKKSLFVFYQPESIYTDGKWNDPNWEKFFNQFMNSDFVTGVFLTSKNDLSFSVETKKITISKNWKNPSSAALDYILKSENNSADLTDLNDLDYSLQLEKIFSGFWNSQPGNIKDKLSYYSAALHVISNRFYERESEEIRSLLDHISQRKIDGIQIEDWLARLIYGSLDQSSRIAIHKEWSKQLSLTVRNSRHPETWALHHHLFFSRQYEDSIEVLNDIVDDELSMDIDGYLPAVIHDYEEADLPEEVAVEIEEIKDLL